MAIEERAHAPAVPNHNKLWIAGGVLGAGFLAVSLAFWGARTAASLLLAGTYGVSLAAAALLLIALAYVTGAGWSVVFRRVPESIASALPWMALVLAPAALGIGALYHWSHAEAVAEDPLLAAKAVWLNVPFFLGRGVFYVLVWALFARAIRKRSLAQDQDGAVRHTKANVKLSAVYLIVFGLTFSAASFDWLMSLDPHWFSTMFAVYNFSGAIISALALMLVVVILLRRSGFFGGRVNDSHVQDLSRLLFGFCCFWAYIWFSQYMLIWYANLPEETGWFVERMSHGWGVLFWTVPVLCFCLPFAALLSRDAKRNETLLLQVAGVILLGRWIDLYVTIGPTILPEGPTVGLPEIGATLLGAAVMAVAVGAALRRAPPVPERDPYYEESVHHHIGHTM